jgi:hypothetical protein
VQDVADIVFAFDPAIDRPLAIPEAAPTAVAAAVGRCAADSFAEAVAVAKRGEASALVICGRWLDPRRASPAQAAAVRGAILELAAAGCRTVYLSDGAVACQDLARMFGEPQGLFFATPQAPLELDIHGVAVEFVAATEAGQVPAVAAEPVRQGAWRRIVVGWDTAVPTASTDDTAWPGDHDPASAFVSAAAASPAWMQPGGFWIWASRRRPALPAGMHHLPPLQPRSPLERAEGSCCTLTLLDRHADEASELITRVDWRGSWREIPTQRVGWRTVTVESASGGDEELATALWSAIEQVAPGEQAPLELVRCIVECGTSVSRRVRVGELAAETLARLRELFDPKRFRAWPVELVADPGESLSPLGHARSGGKPGSTTSFTSALADLVAAIEHDPAADFRPAAARQAGWVALELIEST